MMRSSFVGLSLSLAILAPAAEGVQSAPLGPRDQAVQAKEDPAERILKIEPKIIDFGEIHRGDRFERTVTLTNTSNEPVVVTRAFATCGCTVPEVPVEPIQPGESAEVVLEYLAQNPGPAATTVQFFLDRQLGAATMSVTANVLHPIIIEPANFDPYTKEATTFTLTSTDGSEFQIYAAEPEIFRDIDETPRVKQEITLDLEKLEAMKNRPNAVRFYVDHPRTTILFLRSSHVETSTQTQRIINWARGQGEISELEALINEGIELHEPDGNGRTPLMYAALMGQVERAMLLIDAGAQVDQMRPDGETALMTAAKGLEGNVATVELLLAAGADINARDQYGRTPLFWAARSGDPARVRLLLENGADINVRGPFDETELIAAVKSRNLEKVALLIEAGADVRAKDANGRDALGHARAALAYTQGPPRSEVEEIIRILQARLSTAD